ncbi:lysylphosphatidylglycerol synthase transmembrane domain-containing protein [Kitasatospora sp. NPDC002227]|uniref:lysylphosphatidylglycerol synthase transmembrane domain-containing protein n=1 Tax=Kitasatospora sp. NPDC002227 TaxID=3154773 RepID=UPI00332949CA
MPTVIQDDVSEAVQAEPEKLRVRHPAALVRALTGAAGVGLTLLLAVNARGAAAGLTADVAQGTEQIPWALGGPARAVAAVALLLLPLAYTARRLVQRAQRGLAEGVAAAVLAYGFSLGLDAAFGGVEALRGRAGGDVVHGHLAPVLAFLAATGATRLPKWRTALAAAVALSGLSGLATGHATPLSLVLALLLGWAAGHGTSYGLGAPVCRPAEAQLLAALGQAGTRPDRARRVGPGRYFVTQRDGLPELDVLVLDPRVEASGWAGQLWRLLRLRAELTPRGLRPLRTNLEHEALLSYAVTAAGVRTRHLATTTSLGPDSALVAYHRLPGRTLTDFPEHRAESVAQEDRPGPPGEVLVDAWEQLRLLQRRRIAHRGISPETVLVGPGGEVHLVGLGDGEIAAGELPLRLDVAGMLSTLALHYGAERAVRSGVAVLGAAELCAALPLLQPIALAPATRAALRRHPELLAAVREEVLRGRPQVEVQPVRLERLRPRTLLTVGAGVAAAVLLIDTLLGTDFDPFGALADADPFWLGLAVLAYTLSHLAATCGFVGFVPERLGFRRAVAVQLAGSFAKLVSPGGVGGVALNTRFLQCSGIPTPQALSSVGVGQLAGLVLHLLQLGLFATLLGRAPGGELPSAGVLAAIGAGACVLAVVGFAVPWVRQQILRLLRPLRAEVLPRLLDLAQQPGKLALGVAGQLGVSLAFVACLYCCAAAVGQHPSFTAVAVAFLAGNAVGSAAPTPGGVGLVEALLTESLARMTGMDRGAALAAVTLFRVLTFLAPVLPGWAAFAWLQRRRAL